MHTSLRSLLAAIAFATLLISAAPLNADAQTLDPVEALAVPLIIEFEDFSAVKYRCQAGVVTQGYGTTGSFGCANMSELPSVIDETLAMELLLCGVRKVRAAIRRLVKARLTPEQEAALVVWAYNLGEANLAQSTMLKRLNDSAYDEAARELLRWNKVRDPESGRYIISNGLVRRRAAEFALFTSG